MIAAVKWKKWQPNEHTWLCSAHFVSEKKNNDPLSTDFIPSIFSFVCSPQKRKSHRQLSDYKKRRNVVQVRLENTESSVERGRVRPQRMMKKER